MLARFVRILVSVVAVIVAYQAYALVAVPWLEPPLAVRVAQQSTAAEREAGRSTVNRYQQLLAAYFPAGHWSLAKPPKVIESGPAMLVLDDYQRYDDGRVDLMRCAILLFPTPRQESATPPRDAIIVEAPQGARLQFDEDFRPDRGQIGQITRGEFPGRITIRSDMHEPGPDDDLLVETADLMMNSKLMYTSHEVRFRLGENVGGGRELEIRFLEDEPGGSGGLNIAGVDSIEVRREVRLRMLLQSDALMPGDKQRKEERPDNMAQAASGTTSPIRLASAEVRSDVTPAAADPPVEVTCSGPFHFDMVRYIASFDENVEVRQLNPDGPSDQLSCQQLDVHFAPVKESTSNPNTLFDPSKRQREDLGRLEPDKIVAQGHPVVIVSPSRGAEARGSRVQLKLREHKLAIDGGQDVMLVYGANVVRAPAIQYQHPAADAETKIGTFWAGGPGTLHYLADPAKPDQVLEAVWQESVELSRFNGQPVLVLEGRPQLSVTEMGYLAADKMHVYLRELHTDRQAGPQLAPANEGLSSGQLQVVPDRMRAVGNVEIVSVELSGQMNELTATFHVEPELPGDQSASSGSNRLAARTASSTRDGQPPQSYRISADKLRLEIALRGSRAVPKRLECEGNVMFGEVATQASDELPLTVRGEQLTVSDLDTSATRVSVIGVAPGEAEGNRMAEVEARGVTVRADDIQVDEGENRIWIDGPGEATMQVTRDLEGRETGTPYPVDIHWQGGMNFDGRFVTFSHRVLLEGADDRLRCDQLTAKLSAPVRFGESVDQQAVDLAELMCEGQVMLDHRSRDAGGVTSHERVQLARLAINQQTGVIHGDGPGTIRSTHFANQMSEIAGPTAQKNDTQQNNTQLHFLRVDFQRGVAGNLYTHEMSFFERVRTVYGPIDAWQQELDINRPETLPAGSMTMTCEELNINEDPLAKPAAASPGKPGQSLGPVQLQAKHNVRIEGESDTQGMFAAQADRVSFDQAKDLLVLEGGDRTPATLWHQRQVGDQLTQHAARKIYYWRSTGQFKVEDIRFFDFTPPNP